MIRGKADKPKNYTISLRKIFSFIHIIRSNWFFLFFFFFFLTTDSYFLLDRAALCKVQRCYKMISVCLCPTHRPMELINHPPVRIYSSVCIFFAFTSNALFAFQSLILPVITTASPSYYKNIDAVGLSIYRTHA